MNNLREEIIQEIMLVGIKDIDGIINTLLIAFDVEEVNQDVVDAIREDYLSK